MTTRWIVYDDNAEKAITYQGNLWFSVTNEEREEDLGNLGAPYLHTLHGTNHNATVFFESDGTFVAVWGTSFLSNPMTNPDPNLECFIDGVSIGRDPAFQFPENNFRLCGKDGLFAGPHKLQIDITVQSPEQTFWLDQIQYTPSPWVPLEDCVIRLANTDPAIRFDDSWGRLGKDGTEGTTKVNAVAHVDFNGENSSYLVSSQAFCSLKGLGSSVSWIGSIPADFPPDRSFGTFLIDNGEPNNFNFSGLQVERNETLYSQFLFTSMEVENGPLTLTVTFLGSEDTAPLTLDYLYIKNGTLPASASNTSSTSVIPNPTGSISGNSREHSRLNIGALLGGVLGGLGLILIIAGAFLYRKHRRLLREKIVHSLKTKLNVHEPQTTLSPDGTSIAPPIPYMMAQTTHANAPRQPSPVVLLSTKTSEAFSTAPVPTNSARPPSRQQIDRSGAGNSPRQMHTNSGIWLNQPPDTDVPPQYSLD